VSGEIRGTFDAGVERWTDSESVPSPFTASIPFSSSALRRYMLYLPLRNSIYNGTLSVNTGSFLGAGGCARDMAPPLKRPPIVWYGTR
jgi:hypothetical protein